MNPVVIRWQFHGCTNLDHFQFPQYTLSFPPLPTKPSSSQQGPSYSDVFCLMLDSQGSVTVVLMSMSRGLAIGKWLTSQWHHIEESDTISPQPPQPVLSIDLQGGVRPEQRLSYAWWDVDSPHLVQVCGVNHSWGEFMTALLVSWPEDIVLQLLSSSRALTFLLLLFYAVPWATGGVEVVLNVPFRDECSTVVYFHHSDQSWVCISHCPLHKDRSPMKNERSANLCR